MSVRSFHEKMFELPTKNVVEIFNKTPEGELKLGTICKRVISDYEFDKGTRSDWDETAKEVLELANMKFERKDTPFIDSANIKSPLIAQAAIQFSSTAFAEMVRKDKAVQMVVLGKDPAEEKYHRAMRVEDYMNYQLLIKNCKWLDCLDRTLQMLGVLGTVFHKVYFDPICGDNVVELCLHNEIYIRNDITSLEQARRITHKMKVHNNWIVERMRADLFVEVDDEVLGIDRDDNNPLDEYHEVLEQHCFLDLDEDGYEEPYIVTILKDKDIVLSIVPRFKQDNVIWKVPGFKEIKYIKPDNYFVDFHFIPAMDGTYYSIGLGALLHTMTRTYNTAMNQLLDAGKLCNTKTGFISKGLMVRPGDTMLTPGMLKPVDTVLNGRIDDHISILQFGEPSQVLFSLLEVIDQKAKSLSSTGDMMTGEQLGQNMPATTALTLNQNSMRTYNGIQKRLFRAADKEYKLLYELNRVYLDPQEYLYVLDDPMANPEADFEDAQLDIKTVADPDISSDAQRLAQAQMLIQMLQQPAFAAQFNLPFITMKILEASGFKDIEAMLTPQGPTPEQQQAQMEAQLQQQVAQAKIQDSQTKQFQAETARLALIEKAEQNNTNAAMKAAKLEHDAYKIQADDEHANMEHLLENQKIQTDVYKTNVDNRTKLAIEKMKDETNRIPDVGKSTTD